MICPECKGRGYIDLLNKRVECKACAEKSKNDDTMVLLGKKHPDVPQFPVASGVPCVQINPSEGVKWCEWQDKSERDEKGRMWNIRSGHMVLGDGVELAREHYELVKPSLPKNFIRDQQEFVQDAYGDKTVRFLFVDFEMVWRLS